MLFFFSQNDSRTTQSFGSQLLFLFQKPASGFICHYYQLSIKFGFTTKTAACKTFSYMLQDAAAHNFRGETALIRAITNTITKCKAPAPAAPGPAVQIYNLQGNLSQLFFTVSLFLGLKDFQSLLTTSNMHNYPKHPK